MLVHLRRAVIVSVFFLVLLGIAYPLAETGIGQALFHHQANGSLGAHGSARVGQVWKGPQWFHGRPDSDDPLTTGGSNLGTHSQALLTLYRQRVAQLERDGINPTPDLVAASGSGVDPDISAAAAYAQVDAVAKARGLSSDAVHRLVADHVQGAQWGFLGADHVNVLELNLALTGLR